MSLANNLIELLEEIADKEDRLCEMVDNWYSVDECARACSDPGLQYELESEIDSDYRSFLRLVKEMIPED